MNSQLELPKNFHRKFIPEKYINICLGTEKLTYIWNHIVSDGKYHDGDRIVIPFGGPGSMTIFFDSIGVSTLAGDIHYSNLYPDPKIALLETREWFNFHGTKQSFFAWNARKLPIADSSQTLAIINPPYCINCQVDCDPIQLVGESFLEIERILEVDGSAYFVFPNFWQNQFRCFTEYNRPNMLYNLLSESISSNPDTKNPLCLIRMDKNAER